MDRRRRHRGRCDHEKIMMDARLKNTILVPMERLPRKHEIKSITEGHGGFTSLVYKGLVKSGGHRPGSWSLGKATKTCFSHYTDRLVGSATTLVPSKSRKLLARAFNLVS